MVQPPPDERSPLLLPRLVDQDDAQVRLVRNTSRDLLGYGFWVALSSRTSDLFAAGGAVDAAFAGSMGGKPLADLIVGIASTPDGKGYWEVGSDGGIFAFGDAAFAGSMGGQPLGAPIVGIAVG